MEDMNDGGVTLVQRAMELRRWINSGEARKLREDAGVSQAVVAETCQVNTSTVHHWENGRLPRGRNLVAYHRCLVQLSKGRDGDVG